VPGPRISNAEFFASQRARAHTHTHTHKPTEGERGREGGRDGGREGGGEREHRHTEGKHMQTSERAHRRRRPGRIEACVVPPRSRSSANNAASLQSFFLRWAQRLYTVAVTDPDRLREGNAAGGARGAAPAAPTAVPAD